MKFKFRAEPRDVFVFIIFLIVLFYLVAIGVLNVSSFIKSNTYHGFNPMPAFTPDFFAPTIVFFIFSIIIILSSVSSYFFERERGFGVSLKSKEEKGYSRWARDKEYKEELRLINPQSKSINHAGIPLINNGKEIWVDDGEYHNLIIGATGSGKTQIVVHPLVKLLAKKGESMIVTDPKGEIYEESAALLKERGYNIVVLNFRDPQRGNSWNPLNLPYQLYKEGNQDKAVELLEDLGINIIYDESAQNQDPFWEKTSSDYFTGLALALFEDANEAEINLNSINLMTTVGEEKYLGSTYIKEYFNDKDPISPAYLSASSTIMAPTDTKGSILSVFKQKIKLFSSRENISEMLSHNDFDIKDIGRKKTAVFIVVQDEKKTYHSLVTIFIKQCYETLIDVAQENGGKLEYRTNFILDEFANMPPLKDVTTMVTAARSRSMRFNFIIQNFAQLYQVYGRENGETIKGNCGNIIYLISSELGALEEISKLAGEVKSKEKEKTASMPLVTVSDLQRLKQWETIVLRTRMMPFKTKLTPNYKMNWGENLAKSEFPTRDKKPVMVFDLKGFVENKRKQVYDKANNIMGNDLSDVFGSNFNFSNLDIEDQIKKIDQKIAELEAEELKQKTIEQLKPKKSSVPPKPDTDDKLPTLPKKEAMEILTKPLVKNEKEIIYDKVIKEESHIIAKPKLEIKKNIEGLKDKKKQTYITDDQFFDDFFSDD